MIHLASFFVLVGKGIFTSENRRKKRERNVNQYRKKKKEETEQIFTRDYEDKKRKKRGFIFPAKRTLARNSVGVDPMMEEQEEEQQ